MDRARLTKLRAGKHTEYGSGRARSRPLRLAAALLAVAALAAAKAWIPGADAAVGNLVEKNLSGGADYRAALAALGEAVSGEGDLAEVWSALDGAEEASADRAALPASGGGDFALGLPEPGDTVTVDELNESIEPGYEELLLPFPEDEASDVPSDTPSTVSYEHLVLDFEHVLPVEGTVTCGFGFRIHPLTGKRSFHYGVDIGAPLGTDIASFAAGTVELVGYSDVYGNYLFIRHADGILTFYGHCSKVTAVEGQLVNPGDVVAKVGSTGWSTGPHLHFEVRSGDKILEPTQYLDLG